jgi:hypothetical protein
MKRALWITWFVISAPLLGFGCSSTEANATNYDQSCEVAEDCVAVIDGDVCCGCPNAAINKGAKADYDADLGECDELCDIFCAPSVVSCVEGTCAVAEQDQICTPGSELFCKCGPDQSGTQVCNETGTAFGECVC